MKQGSKEVIKGRRERRKRGKEGEKKIMVCQAEVTDLPFPPKAFLE